MEELNTGQEDGFLETVCSMEGGTLVPELDRKMKELVKLVKARGGSGEINLKLKMKEGETEGTMLVIPEMKLVEPKKKRMVTLMFTNDTNGLSQDRPEQTPLFRMPAREGEEI